MSKTEQIERLKVKAARRKLKILALKEQTEHDAETIDTAFRERGRYRDEAAQVEPLRNSLRDANARAATAEQQMEALKEQRDRLRAVLVEYGGEEKVAIALDPVRWSDWVTEFAPKEA